MTKREAYAVGREYGLRNKALHTVAITQRAIEQISKEHAAAFNRGWHAGVVKARLAERS